MAPGGSKSTDSKQHIRSEENRIAGLLNFVILLSVAAVAYTDWIVAPNISLGYLYVLPIALSALVNRLALTIALVAVCTVLQDLFAGIVETQRVRMVRDSITLAGFLIVAFLVTQIARQRNRLAAEVRRQRDEYERDLVLAAQVQRQVLPTPPVCRALELGAVMQTAQLLGGDYYDFFQISESVVDVVIADVSGHGAAASLLMPSLAVALRMRARELEGPAAIIKDLDKVLQQITNAATFVTMFYGRFDQNAKTLEYASGGHNPPLLFRPKTNERLQLSEAGPIVGILKGAEFYDTVVALEPGDVVTLFTDGVIEQENEAGAEFSLEGLEDVIVNNRGESATALVARIAAAVSSFAGAKEQADDLTVVVIKIS